MTSSSLSKTRGIGVRGFDRPLPSLVTLPRPSSFLYLCSGELRYNDGPCVSTLCHGSLHRGERLNRQGRCGFGNNTNEYGERKQKRHGRQTLQHEGTVDSLAGSDGHGEGGPSKGSEEVRVVPDEQK